MRRHRTTHLNAAILSVTLSFLVACTSSAAPQAQTVPGQQGAIPPAGIMATTSNTSIIVAENGTFIKTADQDAVYIMEDGRKRLFTDWDTFLAWGGMGDFANVKLLTLEQFGSIPIGTPIPNGSRPPGR